MTTVNTTVRQDNIEALPLATLVKDSTPFEPRMKIQVHWLSLPPEAQQDCHGEDWDQSSKSRHLYQTPASGDLCETKKAPYGVVTIWLSWWLSVPLSVIWVYISEKRFLLIVGTALNILLVWRICLWFLHEEDHAYEYEVFYGIMWLHVFMVFYRNGLPCNKPMRGDDA